MTSEDGEKYKLRWEAAQLCLNKIDDHLEYDCPKHKTFESIKKEVRYHLSIYTETVSNHGERNNED